MFDKYGLMDTIKLSKFFIFLFYVIPFLLLTTTDRDKG